MWRIKQSCTSHSRDADKGESRKCRRPVWHCGRHVVTHHISKMAALARRGSPSLDESDLQSSYITQVRMSLWEYLPDRWRCTWGVLDQYSEHPISWRFSPTLATTRDAPAVFVHTFDHHHTKLRDPRSWVLLWGNQSEILYLSLTRCNNVIFLFFFFFASPKWSWL